MLLDNENENLKVHEWITRYTTDGKMDVVTGYFTIGALAYISEHINERVKEYRLVLGDIVNVDNVRSHTLNLLNENITVEAAIYLSKTARNAVEFLKQDKVIAKTLEPNFCHAKAYIFKFNEKDPQQDYFITGSSNLTEAGLGMKVTSNVELNIADFGSGPQYRELKTWFNELWKRPQAHTEKTLFDEKGKKYKKPFKQYLIEEIERIFIEYTPKELYYKVLFELFGSQLASEQDNPEFSRQIGRLENTVIYNTLYEFQQKGVLSLILMLQKYNGAILADAVGLGKTWSALAVMKFFQLQGREVILLCPKKLENNWRRYLRRQDSKFEKDDFDYFIRFHTDMEHSRMKKYKDRSDFLFKNDKPKLFVIDESHNLRNDKSKRYKFFLEKILQKNEDVKVLMLSATPINNSLTDIRNQFKLPVKGNVNGYSESLGVRNIDYTFRRAQKSFNEWRETENNVISEFISKIPAGFFTLTDSLIVARTRKMIEGQQTGLTFPKKAKPINLFVTPKKIGNYESFEALFDEFPPKLSGYQPSMYIDQEDDVDILNNERQRDFFLVKMMYILMVKRLESSWFSFHSTVEKIKNHHQNALDKIVLYQEKARETTVSVSEDDDVFEDDDDIQTALDEFTLGKKRLVKISDIAADGNLEAFKKDLKADIAALDVLHINIMRFKAAQDKELEKQNNHKSIDDKLEVLIEQIKKKRKNNDNKKVIIFTVYKDTAFYLFDQLKARGFDQIAAVTGSESVTDDAENRTKKFEPILERFSPFTKLFREKEWPLFEPSDPALPPLAQYAEWKEWVKNADEETAKQLANPIEILIASDALSEGQNLQDSDLVINYDIHWNPVRIIQRMGRIDRLGSPNDVIYGINFWPSDNINAYLNLQGRIEQRMAAMKLAGSEVNPEFSETFAQIAHDEELEAKQKNIMLRQMEVSFEEIDGEKSFGFDDLSLETYRQDLLAEMKQKENYYRNMPRGIYTGFKADKEVCEEKGIIALMGYPARPQKSVNHVYQSHELIYIDKDGKQVLLNQKEVLDVLAVHQDEIRYVPKGVDKGDPKAIDPLIAAIGKWIKDQTETEVTQADGTVKKRAGKASVDLLKQLRAGNKKAVKKVEKNETSSEKYQTKNFDLITWFLIN